MKTPETKHLYEVVRKNESHGFLNIEETMQLLEEAKKGGATHIEITDGEDYNGCGEYVPNGTTEFDFYTVKEMTPEEIEISRLTAQIEQKKKDLQHEKNFYKSQRENTKERMQKAQELLQKSLEEHVPTPDFESMQKQIDDLKSQLEGVSKK